MNAILVLESKDIVASALKLHPSSQMFSSIDELLRKAPMVRATVSLTRAELHRQWQEWKGECGRRRDGGDFMTLPQLHLLCRVSVCVRMSVCCKHQTILIYTGSLWRRGGLQTQGVSHTELSRRTASETSPTPPPLQHHRVLPTLV